MPLLQIENLSKSFGDRTLFASVGLSIDEGDKVGLIARNGSGKTTLLNIIAGREGADSGAVTLRRDLRVAYLVQNPAFKEGTTVLEACFAGDSPALCAIAAYERAVADDDHAALQQAIAAMDSAAAWDYESKAKEILTRLGVEGFDRRVDRLSIGQLKRVALAGALISEPELLVLDEPTNHLDIDVTVWLEEYLSQSRLALLMVTHDRYFLDRVCNRIVELDDRTLYTYKGNFEYYLEKRQERLDTASAQAESDRNRFRRELEWMRATPQARSGKSRSRKEAFYKLEESLDRGRAEGAVQLDVKSSYIGKKIFEIHNLSKCFGDRVVLDRFNYTFSRYQKLGIVGRNGTGKSTFLKLLTGTIQPDSGTVDVGTTVRFGYYTQQGMEFDDNQKVIDAVTDIAETVDTGDGRRMTASQFLQYFLFAPAVQHNFISRLSGGERRRLYLCTILMRSPNFLVLDEPTNDLDIVTLQVLEEYLQSFGGCVIVVSHDRCFMDKVADRLLVFGGEGRVKEFAGSYSDYLLQGGAESSAHRVKGDSAARALDSGAQPAPSGRTVRDRSNRLSYAERRELESIDVRLPELESEKSALEAELGSGTLAPDQLTAKSIRIGEVIASIDTLTERWLTLSEKEN